MNIPELISQVKSGVTQIVFEKDSRRIGSGSGFLCKNRIISNNHVFHPEGGNFPAGAIVKIQTGGAAVDFPYDKLGEYVDTGSAEDSGDYIVLDIKSSEFFAGKFQFELGSHQDAQTGEEILVLGYPFEHEHLTSHLGYISAQYLSNGIHILQLDASINHGNSGGPLVDPKSKKVIGIITRKATGLTKTFDDLLISLQQNIDYLKQAQQGGGSVKMFGIDTLEYMEISQTQMQRVAMEVRRSANVGIGYAFSCAKLIQENFYLLHNGT